MKKIFTLLICITCLFSITSCAVFKKKEKLGCPGSTMAGQLSNDQKIAKGENVKQSKYKGGRKIY